MSDVHEQEEYERAHGVGAPGAGTYAPPPAATGGYAPPGYTPAAVYGAPPARHAAGMPAPPSQVRVLAGRLVQVPLCLLLRTAALAAQLAHPARSHRAALRHTPCYWVPLQADELQELSVLAKDAAEILWEMAAMGEVGAGAGCRWCRGSAAYAVFVAAALLPPCCAAAVLQQHR